MSTVQDPGLFFQPPPLRGLQTVRVEKDALLDKIKANREEHRSIFEEALDGWQKQVIKDLEDAAADARAGRAFRWRFNLPKPQDHTDEYDTVIEMLEMSKDDEFELTLGEFNSFVMDKWGWQTTFLTSSSEYGSQLAREKADVMNVRDRD